MLAFFIFSLIVSIFVIIPCAIKLGVSTFIESLKLRKKPVIIGIIISSIPLILIALSVLASGASPIITLVVIVIPFAIPAILSGAGVGYFIGGVINKRKGITRPYSETTVEFFRSNSSSQSYSNYNTFVDVSKIEEDPNGKIKDMVWRASNPQPKDLPDIR